MSEFTENYISELVSSMTEQVIVNNLPEILKSLRTVPNLDPSLEAPLLQAIHIAVKISSEISFQMLRQFDLVPIADEKRFFEPPKLDIYDSDKE